MGAWRARNCHHCAKFNTERYDGACEIDGAIVAAYIGNGRVTEEIARRMGQLAHDGIHLREGDRA